MVQSIAFLLACQIANRLTVIARTSTNSYPQAAAVNRHESASDYRCLQSIDESQQWRCQEVRKVLVVDRVPFAVEDHLAAIRELQHEQTIYLQTLQGRRQERSRIMDMGQHIAGRDQIESAIDS